MYLHSEESVKGRGGTFFGGIKATQNGLEGLIEEQLHAGDMPIVLEHVVPVIRVDEVVQQTRRELGCPVMGDRDGEVPVRVFAPLRVQRGERREPRVLAEPERPRDIDIGLLHEGHRGMRTHAGGRPPAGKVGSARLIKLQLLAYVQIPEKIVGVKVLEESYVFIHPIAGGLRRVGAVRPEARHRKAIVGVGPRMRCHAEIGAEQESVDEGKEVTVEKSAQEVIAGPEDHIPVQETDTLSRTQGRF